MAANRDAIPEVVGYVWAEVKAVVLTEVYSLTASATEKAASAEECMSVAPAMTTGASSYWLRLGKLP